MINLYTSGYKSFKIDDAILPRHYQAYINRFGRVILKNVYTSHIINLGNISEVRVDGQISSIYDIQNLTFNKNCGCYGNDENVYKIFDYTFDKTFE